MGKLENYEFVSKEVEVFNEFDSSFKKEKIIVIGLKDKVKDIIIPHPLTNFIRLKFEFVGTSINSHKPAARLACDFMNFIYRQIEKQDELFLPLKVKGLYGLQLIHGSRYLTYLTSRGLMRKTVKYYENYLVQFYEYLIEQSIITDDIIINSYQNASGNWIKESPFRNSSLGTRYPNKKHSNSSKTKLKDFGENRYQLVNDFLEEAKEIAPDIAFGICLQFFGGLRRGEIVNVTRGDLEIIPRNSMFVKIRDNRTLLFSHLKDTSKEFPKRLNYLALHLCKQSILDCDILWDYYEEHLHDLDIKLKKKKILNPSALFIDRDGKAMSGSVYEKRFNKVKKSLIQKLKNTEGRYNDYLILKETRWSTHIGRGIFTNFLLDMGLSVLQIAIARGDSTLDAVMDYIDEKATLSSLKNVMNQLSNTPSEVFGSIEQDIIDNNWKEKRGVHFARKRGTRDF